MAMGPFGGVAAVGVVSERRSISRASRRLERELEVVGVLELSCRSARADFEDEVSCKVYLTLAISVDGERADVLLCELRNQSTNKRKPWESITLISY